MQGMADTQSQGSSALQAYFEYWCSGLHECHRKLTEELIFNNFLSQKNFIINCLNLLPLQIKTAHLPDLLK